MTTGLNIKGLSRRGLALGAGLLPVFGFLGAARAETAPESTFDRIRRTKELRIAVLPGELPYFQKDLASGEWSGACVSMAKDIAKVFDAKLTYTESTYGNSALDLRSNKVEIVFAPSPTPARALSIGFSHPMITHPFGCRRPPLLPKRQPGRLQDARRMHPRAAVRPRRCPHPTDPAVALPSCRGLQREPDTRFREVIDAWLDMARGTGQLREWMLEGPAQNHVFRDQVPASLAF